MSQRGVSFNHDNKFDFQLDQSHPRVEELARIFMTSHIENIEAKDETWQWRRTGNICIEFKQNGKPSGIAITQADHWVHTLHSDDGTILVHLVFPIERLKDLARNHYKLGNFHEGGGDGGRFCNILIPLRDILK